MHKFVHVRYTHVIYTLMQEHNIDVVHSGEKLIYCNIGRFSCIVMIVGILLYVLYDAYVNNSWQVKNTAIISSAYTLKRHF